MNKNKKKCCIKKYFLQKLFLQKYILYKNYKIQNTMINRFVFWCGIRIYFQYVYVNIIFTCLNYYRYLMQFVMKLYLYNNEKNWFIYII